MLWEEGKVFVLILGDLFIFLGSFNFFFDDKQSCSESTRPSLSSS